MNGFSLLIKRVPLFSWALQGVIVYTQSNLLNFPPPAAPVSVHAIEAKVINQWQFF